MEVGVVLIAQRRSLSGYLALLHDCVIGQCFLSPTRVPSIRLVARKGGRTGVLKRRILQVLKCLRWTTNRNLDVTWSGDVLVGSNHDLCGRCTVHAMVFIGPYGPVQG